MGRGPTHASMKMGYHRASRGPGNVASLWYRRVRS